MKLLSVLEVTIRDLGPHRDDQLARQVLHELVGVVNLLLGPIVRFRVIHNLVEHTIELFLRSFFDLLLDLGTPFIKHILRRNLAIELLDKLGVSDRSFCTD